MVFFNNKEKETFLLAFQTAYREVTLVLDNAKNKHYNNFNLSVFVSVFVVVVVCFCFSEVSLFVIHVCLLMELNLKVIGSNIHTSVYDKRDDFGFHIVNLQPT